MSINVRRKKTWSSLRWVGPHQVLVPTPNAATIAEFWIQLIDCKRVKACLVERGLTSVPGSPILPLTGQRCYKVASSIGDTFLNLVTSLAVLPVLRWKVAWWSWFCDLPPGAKAAYPLTQPGLWALRGGCVLVVIIRDWLSEVQYLGGKQMEGKRYTDTGFNDILLTWLKQYVPVLTASLWYGNYGGVSNHLSRVHRWAPGGTFDSLVCIG